MATTKFKIGKKKIVKKKVVKEKILTKKEIISAGISTYFSIIETRKESLERQKKDYQLQLKDLKKLKSLTEVDKDRITYIKSRLSYFRREIKKMKIPLKKEILEEFSKIKRHSQIVGVEIKKNELYIYTHPLKVEKIKIGYYKIGINLSSLSIQIDNLEYATGGNAYDHWCVEDSEPCFGRWRKGIDNYFWNGHLYLMVDTILRFLQSKTDKGYWSFKDWCEKFEAKN